MDEEANGDALRARLYAPGNGFAYRIHWVRLDNSMRNDCDTLASLLEGGWEIDRADVNESVFIYVLARENN